jgi:hypothetical protein
MFAPTFEPIVLPKTTAPSPALFVLCGCQIREIKAAPAALPNREYAKCSFPASFLAMNV